VTQQGTSPAECCPNLRELRVNVWSRGSRPHNDIQIVRHALAGVLTMPLAGAHACKILVDAPYMLSSLLLPCRPEPPCPAFGAACGKHSGLGCACFLRTAGHHCDSAGAALSEYQWRRHQDRVCMHGGCLLNPLCGTHVCLLTALLQPASTCFSGCGCGKLVPLLIAPGILLLMVVGGLLSCTP
jgi:hypothetical protein